MRAPRLLLSCSCVAAMLGAPWARAQAPAPRPSPADVKAAAAESETGARLLGERLYEPAAIHYQKAYDLAHNASDLQHLAETYRGMGDLAAAYDAYGKLVANHPTSSAAQSPAVKKALADLEAATGLLSVHCAVQGALVRVGDRVVGVTPLTKPIRIAMGPVRVQITQDGFQPFTTNVAIDPAHVATVDASLVQAMTTGHLAVRDVHQAEAQAIVDGRDVGSLPWEGDVAPGIHTVSLRGATIEATPQTIKVRAGARAEAVFLSTFTAGQLSVTAVPATAAIEIDGKPASVGKYEDDVPVGEHVVRVSAPGYKAAERHVTIAAQRVDRLTVELDHWVSPEEEAEREAEEDADAIRGGYGGLTVFGTYPFDAAHVDCTQLPQASCSNGLTLSGGAAVRGGYSFGWIGVELVGLFLAEGWQDTAQYPGSSSGPGSPAPQSAAAVPHQETYSFSSAGGMIAIGPRFTTPGRHARFTIGVAGGVAVRDFNLTRDVSAGLSDNGSYAGHQIVVSPGFTGDIGVILGSTPGANFVLGAMMWLDLPSGIQSVPQTTIPETDGVNQYQTSVGPVTIENAPQVYIGPYMGIRFGH